MEPLRPIGFTAALLRLQEMIDSEVKVVLNRPGRFFGCGFGGKLLRVRTLPPDHSAIHIVLGDGQGLFLDPDDVDVFLGSNEQGDNWLEFQTDFGLSLTVE